MLVALVLVLSGSGRSDTGGAGISGAWFGQLWPEGDLSGSLEDLASTGQLMVNLLMLVTILSQRLLSLTIVFLYKYARGCYALNGRVMFPDSLISDSCLPYHVPPAWVLVRFLSVFTCFPYLYKCGPTTRLLTICGYACLFSSC